MNVIIHQIENKKHRIQNISSMHRVLLSSVSGIIRDPRQQIVFRLKDGNPTNVDGLTFFGAVWQIQGSNSLKMDLGGGLAFLAADQIDDALTPVFEGVRARFCDLTQGILAIHLHGLACIREVFEGH